MEINYSLEVHTESEPVRGNAIASGDEAYDREVENAVIEAFNNGNIWAWATVTVTATVDNCALEGRASLGCCSYTSEEDFRNDAYYSDLCEEAKEDLLCQLNYARECANKLGIEE